MLKLLIFVLGIGTVSARAQYVAQILPTGGGGQALAAADGEVVGRTTGPGGGPTLWYGPFFEQVSLDSAKYTQENVLGVGGGKQVGYGVSEAAHALLWAGSAGSVVDLHPAGYNGSRASGTDGKQQVGAAGVGGGDAEHAVVWENTSTSFVDLHPAGYLISEAQDVFGGVQVGGVRGLGAVIWHGSAASMEVLPTPKNFTAGDAVAIHGTQAVGRIVSYAAVVWNLDTWTYTSLGEGFALDTNGVNQVGYAGAAGDEHALRWSGTEASRLDLHQFLPRDFENSVATGVDENGNIVGYGTLLGVGTVPLVWTPVPEPTTVAVLAVGLFVLAMRKRD